MKRLAVVISQPCVITVSRCVNESAAIQGDILAAVVYCRAVEGMPLVIAAAVQLQIHNILTAGIIMQRIVAIAALPAGKTPAGNINAAAIVDDKVVAIIVRRR